MFFNQAIIMEEYYKDKKKCTQFYNFYECLCKSVYVLVTVLGIIVVFC